MNGFVTVLKRAGPATAGLAIAVYGVVGGQFAAKFKEPFDGYASILCILAMAVGLGIAVFRALQGGPATRSSRPRTTSPRRPQQ